MVGSDLTAGSESSGGVLPHAVVSGGTLPEVDGVEGLASSELSSSNPVFNKKKYERKDVEKWLDLTSHSCYDFACRKSNLPANMASRSSSIFLYTSLASFLGL